jgi:hypothetical protein
MTDTKVIAPTSAFDVVNESDAKLQADQQFTVDKFINVKLGGLVDATIRIYDEVPAAIRQGTPDHDMYAKLIAMTPEKMEAFLEAKGIEFISVRSGSTEVKKQANTALDAWL